MEDEKQYEARLDAMVAETQDLIHQTRDSVQKLQKVLQELGYPANSTTFLQDMANHPETGQEVRDKTVEAIAELKQSLQEEEQKISHESTGKKSRPVTGSKI